MTPVILSGGSGTRLWPTSRTKWPKQFCEIFDKSLHRLTIDRLQALGSPWVVTSQGLRDLTLRDARESSIPADQLIFEPVAKNTAPAIAALCKVLELRGRQNEIVGIFPADHLIQDEAVFQAGIRLAEKLAELGRVVTLGISPDSPATGYGYIQTSKEVLSQSGSLNAHAVVAFHEKPTLEKAQSYLREGSYFWNAGIFVFRVSTMISMLKEYQPAIWTLAEKIKSDLSNLAEIYAQFPSISIDYAILEKIPTDKLACVPCAIGWNDVGSWDAIADMNLPSRYPHVEVNARGNFVSSQLDKTYAFIGIEDLIVVDTEDALLIAKKGSTQHVKDVHEQIRKRDPKLVQEHKFEHRPWGQYEVLRDDKHFKSKVIEVLPQQQISYQSHAKREEHWLITRGTGEVVLNDEVIPVKAGSYVKIPLGARHRIRCTGSVAIQFVEVQMGSYFGEDDIVRYQDDYQRS